MKDTEDSELVETNACFNDQIQVEVVSYKLRRQLSAAFYNCMLPFHGHALQFLFSGYSLKKATNGAKTVFSSEPIFQQPLLQYCLCLRSYVKKSVSC